MCNFFSLCSDGSGTLYFFDAKVRKKIKKEKLTYEADSHTSIADYFGFKGKAEDRLNKYEFNPLTKVFFVDQINTTDDSVFVEQKCLALDFKTIVPKLIVKPIVHHFEDRQCKEVMNSDIKLLRKWVSVRASVGASVGMATSVETFVWASVRDSSVEDSVWASVRDSVWVSVRDSVWASVWASVRDSVRDSIGDSTWNSIRRDYEWASVGAYVLAYASSFFKITYQYDLSPIVTLWEKGLVPSFDGKIWRLHGYPRGKILWEGKII